MLKCYSGGLTLARYSPDHRTKTCPVYSSTPAVPPIRCRIDRTDQCLSGLLVHSSSSADQMPDRPNRPVTVRYTSTCRRE
ncbi:hypothetical protein ElyMa_002724800 [Elysia marginata]|uniref:SUEL-type lectin domain-containing protein n=1 Tax=Elysia marginata TaxID=1093978 RepID=A0AAV4HIS5_9GAST|nr:hypothetical protein ElyMa_002724800 [Elysia marginata]